MFKTPMFRRTMSQWLNLLVESGFRLEFVSGPCPTDEVIRACPPMQGAQVVPFFLHIRARRPD
jgi:hypothetical protein